MPNTRDFVDHVLELARSAGRPSARAMFGGHGVYLDGLIVGILIDDTLYLKCDAQSRPAFEARELPAFVYVTREGERIAMTYHRAPEEALESPDTMHEWLRLAQGAALRAAVRKPKRGATTTRKSAARK